MFFEPRILGQALRSRRQRLSDELSTPFPSSTAGFELFERMFESDAVGQQLTRVHEELPNFKHDPMWVQESLHTTLDLLLDRQSEAWHEVNQVQAVRAVTKEELYRRLYKARDYAYATLDQPVSLDDLAYVACLSTNYFLRSFRGLYKQTPHQFIISKRMDRARSLLKTTDLSVSEICLAVGFQSLGSFSWLFKRRCGLSPEAFRRHEQLIGPIL
jgi:AraC-like DNA-binding protein